MDAASRTERLRKRRRAQTVAAKYKPLSQVVQGLRGETMQTALSLIGQSWRFGQVGTNAGPTQVIVGNLGKPESAAHIQRTAFAKPLDFIQFKLVKDRAPAAAEAAIADVPDAGDPKSNKQLKVNNNLDLNSAKKLGVDYNSIAGQLDGRPRVVAQGLLKLLDAKVDSVDKGRIKITTNKAINDLVDWAEPKGTDATPSKRQQAISLFLAITHMAEPDAARNVGIDKPIRGALARIATGSATFTSAFNNIDGSTAVTWVGGVQAARDGLRQRLPVKNQKAFNDNVDDMSDSSESSSSSQ